MVGECLPGGSTKAPVVLLVEDDFLVRMATAEGFRDCGFEVREAANADAAVVLLSVGLQVDIVFSDVTMPGSMDGAGLATWLRSTHPTIRVVLASGVARFLGGTSPPCERVFTKPYSYRAVAEYFRSLLAA